MRKKGELPGIVWLAVEELHKDNKPITSKLLKESTGFSDSVMTRVTKILMNKGKLVRVGVGQFEISAGELSSIDPPQEITPVDPLTNLANCLNEIPNTLISLVEAMVEIMIEPEIEIMGIIERRNRRIADLEVLMSQDKLNLSNARAKINELTDRINRLSAQKNRVIPETKVVYRNGPQHR